MWIRSANLLSRRRVSSAPRSGPSPTKYRFTSECSAATVSNASSSTWMPLRWTRAATVTMAGRARVTTSEAESPRTSRAPNNGPFWTTRIRFRFTPVAASDAAAPSLTAMIRLAVPSSRPLASNSLWSVAINAKECSGRKTRPEIVA